MVNGAGWDGYLKANCDGSADLDVDRDDGSDRGVDCDVCSDRGSGAVR